MLVNFLTKLLNNNNKGIPWRNSPYIKMTIIFCTRIA